MKWVSVACLSVPVNCLQLLFLLLLRQIFSWFTNWRHHLLDGAITACFTVSVLKPLSEGASACQKKMAKVLHLSMPNRCKLHVMHVSCRAHDVLPVCSTPYKPRWNSSLNSQFLCVCTSYVIFCGLKSQSHSDNGHVHATAPSSECVFPCTHPIISCIPPVLLTSKGYL